MDTDSGQYCRENVRETRKTKVYLISSPSLQYGNSAKNQMEGNKWKEKEPIRKIEKNIGESCLSPNAMGYENMKRTEVSSSAYLSTEQE